MNPAQKARFGAGLAAVEAASDLAVKDSLLGGSIPGQPISGGRAVPRWPSRQRQSRTATVSDGTRLARQAWVAVELRQMSTSII